MNSRITDGWQKYKNVLIMFVGIAVAYVVIVAVVQEKLEDLSNLIELQISEQETLLSTIAETTARNGADTVTESIVRDCAISERDRFDTLLGSLDKNLSISELTELERLFGRCGTFYSERKSVMVTRLAREIEIYAAYVAQLEMITDENEVEKFNVALWQTLSDQEKKQSELFTKLVQLQDKIISTLLEGKSVDCSEIAAVLQDVKGTQESLMVANKQAAEARSILISL